MENSFLRTADTSLVECLPSMQEVLGSVSSAVIILDLVERGEKEGERNRGKML